MDHISILAKAFACLADEFRNVASLSDGERRRVAHWAAIDEAGGYIKKAWRFGALREIDGLGECVAFHSQNPFADAVSREVVCRGKLERVAYIPCNHNLWFELVGYSEVSVVMDNGQWVCQGPVKPGLLGNAFPDYFPTLDHVRLMQAATDDLTGIDLVVATRMRFDAIACEVLARILSMTKASPSSTYLLSEAVAKFRRNGKPMGRTWYVTQIKKHGIAPSSTGPKKYSQTDLERLGVRKSID